VLRGHFAVAETMPLRTSGPAISSTHAVWAALIGDVLVTATKIAAAVFTGSAAMPIEARAR